MDGDRESNGGFSDLDVYRRSFALIKVAHRLADKLPPHERYDLGSQIRRAAKSIPANIAEGYGRRRSPKEFCSFLSIAVGSANELEVHFATAKELEYLSAEDCDVCIEECRVIRQTTDQTHRVLAHENGDLNCG